MTKITNCKTGKTIVEASLAELVAKAYNNEISLADADFRDKDVQGIKFVSINLENANFENALCYGADFSYANLKGANFKNSKFWDGEPEHFATELKNKENDK